MSLPFISALSQLDKDIGKWVNNTDCSNNKPIHYLASAEGLNINLFSLLGVEIDPWVSVLTIPV